eukprot:768405-Hanusia_phi.AAC.3
MSCKKIFSRDKHVTSASTLSYLLVLMEDPRMPSRNCFTLWEKVGRSRQGHAPVTWSSRMLFAPSCRPTRLRTYDELLSEEQSQLKSRQQSRSGLPETRQASDRAGASAQNKRLPARCSGIPVRSGSVAAAGISISCFAELYVKVKACSSPQNHHHDPVYLSLACCSFTSHTSECHAASHHKRKAPAIAPTAGTLIPTCQGLPAGGTVTEDLEANFRLTESIRAEARRAECHRPTVTAAFTPGLAGPGTHGDCLTVPAYGVRARRRIQWFNSTVTKRCPRRPAAERGGGRLLSRSRARSQCPAAAVAHQALMES